MKDKFDTKFKIQIIVNGNSLTFSPCTLLPLDDISFMRFSDKFGTIYRYNKNAIISMEELK